MLGLVLRDLKASEHVENYLSFEGFKKKQETQAPDPSV